MGWTAGTTMAASAKARRAASPDCQTGRVSSGWSVTVEFATAPTRSGVPIVEEPCAEIISTDVNSSGGTVVRMFVEAGDEEAARARALIIAADFARYRGLPSAPQRVTVESQRTFL